MRSNYHNQAQSEDSATKISRSKSRNQISIGGKIKQKSGWNERFHLEHIPEYNFQNEPYSQYLKNKFRIPNRKADHSRPKQKQYEASLDKNKVSNKPNMRRNEEKLKEAINKAFADLKVLWFEKSIPECHMELMTKIFNRENNPMKILEDIKHEFSEITKEISLIQKIASSVELRQACFQKILQLIKQLQGAEPNELKVARLFEQKVSHLRILTIHCIECIYQWKQSIEPQLVRGLRARYTNHGKSYLQKMLEDCRNITSSPLKRIFQFESQKTDIFFLNYSCDGRKIIVPKSNIKRIRLCQIMLHEQEEGKEEDSKRTPLIQKVKTPPINRHDKSVPPLAQPPQQSWRKIDIQYAEFSQFLVVSLQKSAFAKSFRSVVDIPKYQQLTIFRHSDTGDEVILGVDRNSSQRKVIILSVKSTLQYLQSSFRSMCAYLWEHDNCNEIRISLLHFQNGEVQSVDVEFQKRLKAVGFRWVSVNHSQDARMTIYSIKRPLDTLAHKTTRRKQAYPVIIQHLTLLSMLESNEKKIPNKCIASVLKLIELLKELKKTEYEQICQRDEFYHHLECLKRISQFYAEEAKRGGQQGTEGSFSYSGLKAFEVDSIETASKIFRNTEVSERRVAHAFPTYISLLNTSFKFRNVTITQQKYTKFLPNKQNEILICQSNYPIYLLQSDEQNINFFIIQVEETFSMESIDSIFHAMGEQSSFIDDFWLPVFHKSVDYIDEVAFKNTQIVSTDYWSCLGSLKRKCNKKRTKIIKPPFVFGMINKKLLEILEIPFYCTLVRKEDLL